ncbi:hypothetical protein T492DRAFT_193700 [Pavlovales sp. CCMP2436]|nr:hypothetical protein T492DRAFT_193700 [Pavlovales sp. CCMP2436]
MIALVLGGVMVAALAGSPARARGGLLAVAGAQQQPAAALYSPSSPVVTIHPYQFAAIRTDAKRTWIFEAYASWCGHCQAFAPTLESLASNLSTYSATVAVGAIDCAYYRDACIAIGVSGFPTLFVWGGAHPPLASNTSASPASELPLAPHGNSGSEPGTEAESSADGAPMHVGGFANTSALTKWLASKLPPLYATVTDVAGVAALADRARTENVSAVVFWPNPLGDIDPALLALSFAGRASFARSRTREEFSSIWLLGSVVFFWDQEKRV